MGDLYYTDKWSALFWQTFVFIQYLLMVFRDSFRWLKVNFNNWTVQLLCMLAGNFIRLLFTQKCSLSCKHVCFAVFILMTKCEPVEQDPALFSEKARDMLFFSIFLVLKMYFSFKKKKSYFCISVWSFTLLHGLHSAMCCGVYWVWHSRSMQV